MTESENLVRAFTFGSPERIPMVFDIPPMCWNHYDPVELEMAILDHKMLFPHFQKGSVDLNNLDIVPWQRSDQPWTDSWGCVWETLHDGMLGAVVKHPLADWDDFAAFSPPDPEKSDGMQDMELSWEELARQFKTAKENGGFLGGYLEHGHTFLRLAELRGFDNLIFDMYDEEPRLLELIEMVEWFSAERVRRYLELGVDMMAFPEDLGMQNQPMLSPKLFRKYIKPTYRRLMQPVKEHGALVHMHSDGYILDLIDDLIDCGVDIINPQDLVNGIDNLAEHVKGRMAIDLDVDRQNVTVCGTPADIDDLIHEEVAKLGSKEGGLRLVFQLWPPTPMENIKAIMDAMEKYSTYYS